MDSFEFNKIAGAVLGTALFVLILSTLSDTVFESHAPEEPVYLANLAVSADEDGGDTDMAATDEEPITAMLASADAGAGEKVAKKCTACHTFENGGANKQGPNLWNIVNKEIGSSAGFKYSGALTGLGADGKVWDYDALNAFLLKPKDYASGTKMAFAGLKKEKDRANILVYLRSLSDAPAPMPAAGDSAAAETATQTAAADTTATDAAASGTETAATETPAESTGDSTDSATMAAADSGSAAPAESTGAGEAEKPAEMAAAPAESTPAESAPSESAAAPAAAEGVLAMIGSQDVAAGQKVARKCKACHTFDEGGKNKSGPPLWDIVNRAVAATDGFKYSAAMKSYAEGGATWTFAELDAFLAAPKKHLPKTKMAFAGLKKEKDRAAILAYLRSLSSDPAPLP